MEMIPDSHKLILDRGRFDVDLYLRQDLNENKVIINSAVDAKVNASDVLFFIVELFIWLVKIK